MDVCSRERDKQEEGKPENILPPARALAGKSIFLSLGLNDLLWTTKLKPNMSVTSIDDDFCRVLLMF